MPMCSTSRRMRTIRKGPRSGLCKPCWRKTARGETMNRVPGVAFRVVGTAIVLLFGVNRMQAQAPPDPPPAQQADKEDEDENPSAPQPAPSLPAGMTGSDAGDPRAKLKPGLYDAGEASMGIKHVLLLKKPDAFQLGASEPDDPKVQKIFGQLDVSNASKVPKPMQLVIAQLAFSNSDFAFEGNHLFQGNFYGVNIYDISSPANTTLL